MKFLSIVTILCNSNMLDYNDSVLCSIVCFRTSLPSSILFSYKAHVDEEDDNVNLPHQSTHVPNELSNVVDYNTSHFDNQSPNPLYHGPGEPEFGNTRPQLTYKYRLLRWT